MGHMAEGRDRRALHGGRRGGHPLSVKPWPLVLALCACPLCARDGTGGARVERWACPRGVPGGGSRRRAGLRVGRARAPALSRRADGRPVVGADRSGRAARAAKDRGDQRPPGLRRGVRRRSADRRGRTEPGHRAGGRRLLREDDGLERRDGRVRRRRRISPRDRPPGVPRSRASRARRPGTGSGLSTGAGSRATPGSAPKTRSRRTRRS